MLRIRRDLTRRLKWGVAGCGKFTETAILPGLQSVRRAKTHSIYSRDNNRARNLAERFTIPYYFDNYQEFLSSEIDAVYIGSMNAHHYRQVIEAAEAKKHILCEKPLSVTAAEAKEMVETCEKNNVFLAVDYVFRFHPLIIKAKELIANQKIGKLLSVSAQFFINTIPVDNFRFNKELAGGGAMRDLGTHLIDILRFLGGEMHVVSGAVDNLIYKSEVDDYCFGFLRYEKEGYADFSASFSAARGFNRIEIVGNRGSIALENLIAQRFGSAKMTVLFEGEAKKAFRKRANKLVRLLKSVNHSFLKNEPPIVTGADGLINMQLMEQIEQRCSTAVNF